ncbi:MAG: fumarylacetoacetate hydrolase family protein [Chloroflexi bacterium]|nr:fumarylacetoacetate hydrolase family protein [Chloroflexota bacterium]
MRLVTYQYHGVARLGAVVGNTVVDVTAALHASGAPVAPDNMLSLLEGGDDLLAATRSALAAGNQLEHRPLDQVKLMAPVQHPRKIICVGLNYKAHAAEGGREPPKVPMYFAKFATAIIGPGDTIRLPKVAQQVDYEAELVVVIGKRAKHVSEANAYDCVAGYMNGNDVSARDLQRETSQFLRGKASDTFAPIGPYLVTKDEVPDPSNLSVKLWYNDVPEPMQSSNTSDFIFNIPTLIRSLTEILTLEPGDLIFTGTPEGVGLYRNPPVLLKPGDRVRVEIGNLGVLENPVGADD